MWDEGAWNFFIGMLIVSGVLLGGSIVGVIWLLVTVFA